jgi:hypothetical protein
MTFEEFKQPAVNPSDDKQSFYRMELLAYANRSEYPQYDIFTQQVTFFRDFNSAHEALQSAIKNYCEKNSRVFCVYIHKLLFGVNCKFSEYDKSWLYDQYGKLVTESFSPLANDGQSPNPFRGRPTDKTPFKPGDIVELISNYDVELGIVVHQPPTIEEAWSICQRTAEALNNPNYCCLDDSDDCYYAFAATDDNEGAHRHHPTIRVCAPHLPVPASLKASLTEQYNNLINKSHKNSD